MLKNSFFYLGFFCVFFFSSCEAFEDALTFNATPSHTIYISEHENPKLGDMHLSSIGPDQFLILALIENLSEDGNWAEMLTREDLTRVAFSVGQIVDGVFEKKLVDTGLNYWVGSGSYWIVFVMADGKMSKVELGYLSKQKVYIAKNSHITRLTNLDFMGSVQMLIDIADMPSTPFSSSTANIAN
ncbi:MAG: hypothetical protein LBC53_03880 [Spirochaetaceae bacterium]|jgi:hypothetical protein|nr:hypothetical protein [Spirochaetaceae bacterium]